MVMKTINWVEGLFLMCLQYTHDWKIIIKQYSNQKTMEKFSFGYLCVFFLIKCEYHITLFGLNIMHSWEKMIKSTLDTINSS
jgi:hypothetical protein